MSLDLNMFEREIPVLDIRMRESASVISLVVVLNTVISSPEPRMDYLVGSDDNAKQARECFGLGVLGSISEACSESRFPILEITSYNTRRQE